MTSDEHKVCLASSDSILMPFLSNTSDRVLLHWCNGAERPAALSMKKFIYFQGQKTNSANAMSKTIITLKKKMIERYFNIAYLLCWGLRLSQLIFSKSSCHFIHYYVSITHKIVRTQYISFRFNYVRQYLSEIWLARLFKAFYQQNSC